ncbi:hypothetical protein CPC16_002840 [Podila verticillata]|nr:hypothetical protein CPC16_002840 [Podila verticillata]
MSDGCLNNYRLSYREATMKFLLQIVELIQGQYDLQLRKVTIQLDSAITTREFFSQLERVPVFKWEPSPSDLRLMVQAIQKSNIRFCKVNLNDYKDRDYNEKLLSRGRYESLLELLSVAKIRSALVGKIYVDDQARFIDILRARPQLGETWKSKIKNFLGSFQKTRTLREIVLRGGWYEEDEVHEMFRLMALSLEKLVLQGGNTQLTLRAFFQLLIGLRTSRTTMQLQRRSRTFLSWDLSRAGPSGACAALL